MKIRKLIIKNFRGIKKLEWSLPNRSVFCLIGKGDSSKSTILEAVKYAFHPYWNLSCDDSDFHQCNIEQPIFIEVTIGELIEEFYSLKKYGHCLRGWDIDKLELVDEPDDNLETVLTVRLTIQKDLAPNWIVACDRRLEGIPFQLTDRAKVSVSMIGGYSEKHLSWATGTALSKLTETQSVDELLANTTRAAKSNFDALSERLTNFNNAAKTSEDIARHLGVPIQYGYKAHLDLSTIDLNKGAIALHDGNIPLRQLGTGSRRMLLCGIQQKNLNEQHITLFDEVEFGLEPYRITRLIKHIRFDKKGQYFLTTHSPSVLRELTIDELYVTHNREGEVQIISPAEKTFEEYKVQGTIRSSAEVFLSKKVVVCEGATEIGFLRGLDDYYMTKGEDPFAYYGVSLLDAEGAGKVKRMAEAFYSLFYEVAVLVDGDDEQKFSQTDSQALTMSGIPVYMWPDNLALEQQAMLDLPWEYVLKSVKLAQNELICDVHQQIKSRLKSEASDLDKNVDNWKESRLFRDLIGTAAKAGNGWFKSITKSERWFKEIASAFDDAVFLKTTFATKLRQLWQWTKGEIAVEEKLPEVIVVVEDAK